jgi:hypothetical protein
MSGMNLTPDDDKSIKSHEEIAKGISKLIKLEEKFQPYDLTEPEEEEFIDLELTHPEMGAEEKPVEFLEIESESLEMPEFEQFPEDQESTEGALPEFDEVIDEDIGEELPLESEEEIERSGLFGRLAERFQPRHEEILAYRDELDEEPIELEPLLDDFDVTVLSQASIFRLRFDENGNLVLLDKRQPRERKPHPKLEAFLKKMPLRRKTSEEEEEVEKESKFSKLKGVFGKITSVILRREEEEESEEESEEEEEEEI